METLDYITTCTCDSCSAHGPVVVLHHLGAPVLTQCKPCMPAAFEAAAREAVDQWLEQGATWQLGATA